MSDFIAPAIIGGVSLGALGFLWYRSVARRNATERVLFASGFRPAAAEDARIDFSLTPQWPEGRGIVFLRVFSKKGPDVTLTVADVRCFEITGARLGRGGSAMRADEIEQTVVSCRFRRRQIPRFILCARERADEILLLVKGEQRTVTGDAAFDAAHFVIGPGDPAAPGFLSAAVRREIDALLGLIVCAGHQSVVAFRQGVVLPPADLRALLKLLGTIVSEAGRSPLS